MSEFVSRAGAAGFTIEELQDQLKERSVDTGKKGDDAMSTDLLAMPISNVGKFLFVYALRFGAEKSATNRIKW